MKKILHLMRKRGDELALKTVERQSRDNQVTCLLLHDATLSPPQLSIPCYALKEDVEARGISLDIPLIDFGRFVELIFEHDSVICW